MDETEFWRLIDQTRTLGPRGRIEQRDHLIEKLAHCSESEILAWGKIFDNLMDRAYDAELWEVASLIDCGCSDDGFVDFRAWLIGQGKDIFEKVVAHPEGLVDIIEAGKEEEAGNSELWYTVIGAYLLKTGKDVEDMPKRERPLPELKRGFSPDMEAVSKRFPRAMARFWKRCQDTNG